MNSAALLIAVEDELQRVVGQARQPGLEQMVKARLGIRRQPFPFALQLHQKVDHP